MFLFDKNIHLDKVSIDMFSSSTSSVLEPSRTSTMELFCDYKEALSQMFDVVLITPLLNFFAPDLTQQKLYNNNIKCKVMFKVSSKFLVSLLLALSIFHTMLQCFYCLLLTWNCRLWLEFRVMFFMTVK